MLISMQPENLGPHVLSTDHDVHESDQERELVEVTKSAESTTVESVSILD